MKIVEIRALRGPNYYHRLPVIFMELELGELEECPSNEVPSFLENIKTLLPGLYEHTCSPRVKGGFFQRIERGTWAGHIAEHVAIELQQMIGHRVTFGKTFTKKPKGTYHMVYRYRNEQVGLAAGKYAVEIVNRLFEGQLSDIDSMVKALQIIDRRSALGPSTQAIVDEATRRGIPYQRLNAYNYVRLGNGKYQRKIEATLMDDTSALGVAIAKNKERTKQILADHGIPVPKGRVIKNLQEAKEYAQTIDYPVVLKPRDGNHGRGVYVNLRNQLEMETAYKELTHQFDTVVMEEYLEGSDYRLMVINYQFQAASLRCPACVTGDGTSTIAQLVVALNQDPRRGEGHENVLTQVHLDEESLRILAKQGFNLETVLAEDQHAVLKATSNISSGGTAIDVTDSVHPSIKFMAERVAKIIGLNVMGIDLIAQDIAHPLHTQRAGIVEVNAGPGFRMHLHPSQGQARQIAQPVVDMIFPEDQPCQIPVCAVTGTNGKTTTTRLIAHILSQTGKVVGLTSTDSVVINNTPILMGDYSGPSGAETVFSDQTVEYAVLEVARGGILRRGLGFKECEVGVLLNVASDHLGYGGIEDLEQLTRLKSVVTESVKKGGFAIYNADDPWVVSRAHKTRGKAVYFSMHADHPLLVENIQAGHYNVSLLDQEIIIQKPQGDTMVGNLQEFPITFEGMADFNIQNVMAAVAATYALGLSEEEIRMGLISFSPTIGQSPGRMNTIDIGEFKVVIDYGHNPAAIRATGPFFRKMMPGRKIRLASGVGNRRDQDIIDYGQAVAESYDEVIITDPCHRNRPKGETVELVRQGLHQAGLADDCIRVEWDELQAAQMALEMAQAGDLIVLQANDIEKITQLVLDYKQAYMDQLS